MRVRQAPCDGPRRTVPFGTSRSITGSAHALHLSRAPPRGRTLRRALGGAPAEREWKSVLPSVRLTSEIEPAPPGSAKEWPRSETAPPPACWVRVARTHFQPPPQPAPGDFSGGLAS